MRCMPVRYTPYEVHAMRYTLRYTAMRCTLMRYTPMRYACEVHAYEGTRL